MTLRYSLLAVLTLGPAYGYQLHAEVVERTRRDAPLNVGQVYSTLDRLRRDGYIEDAGVTADNLPLYQLTEAGADKAHRYLTEPEVPDWHDMVERVLLTLSLPGAHPSTLITQFRVRWDAQQVSTHNAVDPTGGISDAAAQHAARLLQSAAVAWLNAIPDIEPWPLRTDRRRRGRRAAEEEHPLP